METATQLSMSENGRIVIPAFMRAGLQIEAGQRLYLEMVDGGIFISTTQTRRLQRKSYFDQWLTAPVSRMGSEELINERRLEAQADSKNSV